MIAPSRRYPLLVPAIALVLSCCAAGGTGSGTPPDSGVQEDIAAPRAVFALAPSIQAKVPPLAVAPSIAPSIAPSNAPARSGIAGIAQEADTQGNVRRGRDF